MIEVYPGLFIGSRIDYETLVSGQDGWAIVHACRSYHRMAVGYRVWSVAKGHPDYLVAHRENRLMLCLLDLPIAVPIEKMMIERTLDFIDHMRAEGRKVLVHCVSWPLAQSLYHDVIHGGPPARSTGRFAGICRSRVQKGVSTIQAKQGHSRAFAVVLAGVLREGENVAINFLMRNLLVPKCVPSPTQGRGKPSPYPVRRGLLRKQIVSERSTGWACPCPGTSRQEGPNF